MPAVPRGEGHHLAPVKKFIRKEHESDDSCYVVSEKFIFPLTIPSGTGYLEKNLLRQRVANFLCMHSSLLK
jgi:hypothetical protein